MWPTMMLSIGRSDDFFNNDADGDDNKSAMTGAMMKVINGMGEEGEQHDAMRIVQCQWKKILSIFLKNSF